jgi:hypothetical protein
MEKTAVEFLEEKFNRLNGQLIDLDFQQAKQKENQQKIAYKISTPLGHVAHCIEKYGIQDAIEEYKCKLANNKESKFWNDCLKIAEFYKTINQQ